MGNKDFFQYPRYRDIESIRGKITFVTFGVLKGPHWTLPRVENTWSIASEMGSVFLGTSIFLEERADIAGQGYRTL